MRPAIPIGFLHVSGHVQGVADLSVHGLRVEIAAAADPGRVLDWTLANRQGEFLLEIPVVEGGTANRAMLRVRDRVGRLLDTVEHAFEIESGTKYVSLDLTASAIERHNAQRVSWIAPGGGLIADTVLLEVRAALSILAESNAEQRVFAAVLDAATPRIVAFSHLLEEASLALEGDRRALDRVAAALRLEALDTTTTSETRSRRSELGAAATHDAADAADAPLPSTPILQPERLLFLAAAAARAALHEDGGRERYFHLLDQALTQLTTYASLVAIVLDAAFGGLPGRDYARFVLRQLGGLGPGLHDDERFPDFGRDKPLPIKGITLNDPRSVQPIWNHMVDCVMQSYLQMVQVLPTYHVDDISPADACPGDIITITGHGFGTKPGLVYFGSPPGGVGAAATPTKWSDTEIEVAVPGHAICGDIHLVVVKTFTICGAFLDLNPVGTGDTFFPGGKTAIKSFTVNGQDGENLCVLPGATIVVAWESCADEVGLVLTDSAGTILKKTMASAAGSAVVTLPDYAVTTTITAELSVSGACGSAIRTLVIRVQRPFALTISGIEVTQAIQHYHADQHLANASHHGPDNSLQLVAGKSAWVRVYLRSGQDPDFDNGVLPNVSGQLVIRRLTKSGDWSLVAKIAAAFNAPVAARDSFPSYDAERGAIGSSLNFVVPAAFMVGGLLRFFVSVSSPHACGGGAANTTIHLDVNLRQQLRIAAVGIGYAGPSLTGGNNLNLPAPTAAQIAAEANFALTVYPVQQDPDIRVIAAPQLTAPLAGPPASGAGTCAPVWLSVLALVAKARMNDGNQPGWAYYGFMDAGTPNATTARGCADSNGNAASLVGTGEVFAHELGHQAGAGHAPCGAVGKVTPGYPLYAPYDTGITTTNPGGDTEWQDASIGEYGLNINNGQVFSPNPIAANARKDLMSYCVFAWISIFMHEYMLKKSLLNPVTLAADSASQSAAFHGIHGDVMKPILTMLGSLTADEQVDVTFIARALAREPEMGGKRTAYVAELLDEHATVLSSAPVFTNPTRQKCRDCGSAGSSDESADPPFAFVSVMRDVADGSAIRIRRGDAVIWQRERPSVKPVLGPVRVSVTRDRIRIEWRFDVPPDGTHEVWVRWSSDGNDWNGLALGLTGSTTEIDRNVIPASRVAFEVMAHDGFYSVRARSDFVELPPLPAELAIVHPTDNQPVQAGAPLHLWATVLRGRTEEEPQWLLDGEEVGRGLDTWIPAPAPGTYDVEVRAAGALSVRVRVLVESIA